MKHLLGNTDSLQLFPLSYPWAWDMYLENMDNHWTPREFPVATRAAQRDSSQMSWQAWAGTGPHRSASSAGPETAAAGCNGFCWKMASRKSTTYARGWSEAPQAPAGSSLDCRWSHVPVVDETGRHLQEKEAAPVGSGRCPNRQPTQALRLSTVAPAAEHPGANN